MNPGTTNPSRILIAGIGNVFMGDDGFGVAVVRALAERPRAAGVTLMDAGIRGIDLTYALMDRYDAAILVDATPRGRAPGTLYVLVPECAPADPASLLDAHAMDPARVLAVAKSLGGELGEIRIVGCEPERLGTPDEPSFELTPTVSSAVPAAVELVERLVEEFSGAGATIADREASSCTS
jgi:hydrogenase maturation protease